jgi:biopolymer transport protein ExbD
MSFPVSKSNQQRIRKSRSKKELQALKPQLTSLVDVMTILLIYLLTSFSGEGEIITASKDLMLPESSANQRAKLTVVITVNNNYVLAENVHVGNVDDILGSDDLIIPALYSWLEERRKTTEKIEKYSDNVKFKGDITIQGDKRIRFRLLKKIMYTCGQQGYNNFSLAVLKRGA